MSERADGVMTMCNEAIVAADRIDKATDPDQVESLAKSAQVRVAAAIAGALLEIADAIRAGGSPWQGGR